VTAEKDLRPDIPPDVGTMPPLWPNLVGGIVASGGLAARICEKWRLTRFPESVQTFTRT